jgi:hypothetical protein
MDEDEIAAKAAKKAANRIKAAAREKVRIARSWHIRSLRDDNLTVEDILSLIPDHVGEIARPLFVYRLARSNDRPGSPVSMENAALDLDQLIMEYVRKRQRLAGR